MARLTRVRALPWAVLLELAVAAREQWNRLTPGERAHLTALVRKSRGRPGNLTAKDRQDLRRLVAKLEPGTLVRRAMPLGRRMRGRRH